MNSPYSLRPLRDVIDIQSGYAFKSAEYADNGHFLIRIGNVQDGQITLDNPRFVKLNSGTAKFELQEGDVLTSLTGNIGRVAIIKKTHLPAALNQRVAKLILKEQNAVDEGYLLHFLSSGFYRGALSSTGRGAAQQNVSPKDILNILLPIPPISEQKRIVEILDEAFDGIAKATANAQRNLANAGGLLEAMLEKALEPLEGWKETTLANIAEFKNGLNFTRTSKGETIRIVGVKDFQNEYWVPDEGLECVTIDGKLPPLYELQAGDILTVRSNGNKQLIGRCVIVGNVPEKTSHSGFTIRIRSTSSEINPEFLAYSLKSKATRARLVASGGGANISSLNQGALSSLPIKFPNLKEQAQIVTKIHSMTDMCKQLQCVRVRHLSQLEEMKQALLHKAFTGQLTGKEDIAA